MTVTTTASLVQYVGDGVVTDYSVPFPALGAQDIYVYVDDVIQSSGVDYNLIGDVTVPGAVVEFTVAPPDQDAILIQRLTGAVQATEYTTYGQYKAEQHENDFDKAMMIAQENRDIANLAGSGTLPTGIFQTMLQILNSNPAFDAFTQTYGGNIFGGANLSFVLPHNATYDTMSWTLFDAAGNQRDMVFEADGSMNMPGRMRLQNQTSGHGAFITEYSDFYGAPLVRMYFTGLPDLTGTGLFYSWEWVDAANVAQSLSLDPVKNVLKITAQPDGSDDGQIATTKYVDDNSGASPTPTFTQVTLEHDTDEPTNGNATITYTTDLTPVVEHEFDNKIGDKSWSWKTIDSLDVEHTFAYVGELHALPTLLASYAGAPANTATTKEYVDSVAGGSSTPVVDSVTYNYTGGPEQCVVRFTNLVGLGTPPGMEWAAPAINNFSWNVQTRSSTGVLRKFYFIDEWMHLPADPTSDTHASTKKYVDDSVASATGAGVAVAGGHITSDGSGAQDISKCFGVASVTISGSNFIITLDSAVSSSTSMIITTGAGSGIGDRTDTVNQTSTTQITYTLILSGSATVIAPLQFHFCVMDAG